MSKIHMEGRWLWIWGAWHLLWLGGLAYGFMFTAPHLRLFFAGLYTVFLPLEILGLRDLRDDPAGREIAKTKSQWPQALAQLGKPGASRWLGWKAAAGTIGLADGVCVGWLVWPSNPVLAVVLGLGISAWLAPHFADRGGFG